ncbi:efflux RND transporter periplasmic adaptor subunit [Ancylomarina euxinus]|uniref:Efflux RND transporter periplasmic adaptor subunit n=1 Tax=Ancylomarina euxinus TaxID=2283627 RepID=A0A425XXP6_9BACT|nr:efflux RND transporter periplasmic adaptor subunit [Ancylomarina euxinus]MCZ4696000.1 efflux RND transporter periplasmic adaptor subunit [Ancylomarina euxinus]MUP13941.1 efflux RND transporter periplasmic adaptor subunit [Ancylomarina euxinus]RRG19497.1 efflux RND transporter periplasmic adaptor subunit [Ancylomarina euxinus]
MKENQITILILLVLSLFACQNKTIQQDDMGLDNTNLISITKEQFNSDKMEIGTTSLYCFQEEIDCNGFIKAAPEGCAKISTPISGIIKSIKFKSGDFVTKGQVLCEINSNELIDIQQDFIETEVKLKVVKADYDRYLSLFKEKITAEKDFLKIESDFKVLMAKKQALNSKLHILQLDVSRIRDGNLYTALPLKAPISGYIIKQQLMLGQFIEQNQQLIEQVDINKLQLEISIFEKDVNQLELGQTIHFKNIGGGEMNYQAKLISIGKGLDTDSKSILCLASIEKNIKAKLIHGSYIQAKITTNEKDAIALPSNAITKLGNEHFVLVVNNRDNENYSFRKEKVKIGCISKGYTEILGTNDLGKVLLKGVYNISVE